MKHDAPNDRLAQLGEELLREFETAQPEAISSDFDRKCREAICREKKNPVIQILRWSARAAVIVLALVGAMSVAVLSIESLRTPVIEFALAHFTPEPEIRLEEPEEEPVDFKQISYASTDNMTLSVYYDGEDSYQILWADEWGQRLYNFQAPELDEDFFRNLGAKLDTAEE